MPIEEILHDVQSGKPIVIVDDPDRENEGDFFVAGEKVTPQLVNFFATHGRGLICTPVGHEIAHRLNFAPQNARAQNVCNFTLSVDLANGISTGISAQDRAKTILHICNDRAAAGDFVSPGHVFPILAKAGGVAERSGHTEAAVELCQLCGLARVGVICEICKSDGQMARLQDLQSIAAEFDLNICTIEDLKIFLQKKGNSPKPKASSVSKISQAKLPTAWGEFEIQVWREFETQGEHAVLIFGDLANLQQAQNPLVRVHSRCTTGDVFASGSCDCHEQLQASLERIARERCGAIFYLDQEGRGIGLGQKIAAYFLQQNEGLDTVCANEKLGFAADERSFAQVAQIMQGLGLQRFRLLTNNPQKVKQLENAGFGVVRESLQGAVTKDNRKYLQTKKDKLSHRLDL